MFGIAVSVAVLGVKLAARLFPDNDPNAAARRALEAQKLANQIARAEAWHDAGVGIVYALGLAAIVAILAGLFIAALWLGRLATESRARGGLYPIRTFTTPWIIQAMGRPMQIITSNPNNQIPPLAAATVAADGTITGDGSTGGASWELQDLTTRDLNKAQIAAAMNDSPGRFYATQGKYLAGAYDRHDAGPKPAALPAPDPAQAPPAPPLSVDAALARNTPGRLAMGQHATTGDLLFWQPERQPHLRYHGSTQAAGKTSGSAMIAAGAILAGWTVVVLDRRRGKDWAALAAWVQLIDTREPDQFVDCLAQLRQEHARRDAALGAAAAPNLESLPAATRPPRLLIVLEEYGNHRRIAQAAGRAAEADQHLAVLTSEAGAGGIHMLFIDQTPQGWDQTVKANVDGVLTGRLPEHSGQAAGYYWAHQLEPYTYHYDGDVYRNFDAMAPAREILGRRRTPRPPELLTVRPFDRSTVPPAIGGDPAPTPPTPAPTNGANATNATNTAPVTIDPARKWAEFARQWIANGGDGISPLARAMAARDGAAPDPDHPRQWPAGWETYKSTASQEWHHPSNADARQAGEEATRRKKEIRALAAERGIPQAEARRLWLEANHAAEQMQEAGK